jgi:putative PIN family toxin of toxin-antitoxin system
VIVVFDSGIWISAFHFGGIPLSALDHAFVYNEIAICEPVLSEVSRVLIEKFGWAESDIQIGLKNYLAGARHVSVAGHIKGICRDPKDDMLIECAIHAKANAIVSGNKDILCLGHYQGVRILTARQYLNEF